MAAFVPRSSFPPIRWAAQSYFLGHHRAGLRKLKDILSSIDLVIECRDYRVPLTSRNPLLEQSLSGKNRVVVYTKRDLVDAGKAGGRNDILRQWHHPMPVLFSDIQDKRSITRILDHIRRESENASTLTGSKLVVIGMPNVGKSSLLNALRQTTIGGKVAQTGAQPGVTRKVSTMVKIIEKQDGEGGVYLVDSPGVFIPYVPEVESMLKLGLCGIIKDSIIASTILADYLLYLMNLEDSTLYRNYAAPTNNVTDLLESIAFRTGRLQKGGIPDIEAAAVWFIQRWRAGKLGKFALDHVSEEKLIEGQMRSPDDLSISQALKAAKGFRRLSQAS